MKRKLQIGLWIALGVAMLVVTLQVWIAQQVDAQTLGTERLLKVTILPEMNFQDEPLSEALKKWYDGCCQANPEFRKIRVTLQVTNWGWDEDFEKTPEFRRKPIGKVIESPNMPKIDLRLERVPAVEGLRYTSALGMMNYEIRGREIYIKDVRSPGVVPFSDEISYRFSQMVHKIKEFFVAEDPSDLFL